MLPNGTLVRLRPFEPEDAETLWRWKNDREVMRWLEDSYPESLAQFRKRMQEWAPNSYARVLLGIETAAESRLVGVIQLRDARPGIGRAELDVYLGEKDCWNRGYGTEAIRLMCAYGFDTMRLHSIQLTAVVVNESARHVYRKVGFVQEGRTRETFRRDGEWHDEIIMGLLARELLR